MKTHALKPHLDAPRQNTPESSGIDERSRRTRQALQTIKLVSSEAGHGLPIVPVGEAAEIKSRPAVYLLTEPMRSGGEINNTDFTVRPVLLSGAADSAHSVLGGGLTVDYSSGETQEIGVAAKCFGKRSFDDRLTRAVREVGVMQDMQRRGELTMHPIALAIAPENDTTHNEVVVFTEFDRSLLTLDNLPWSRGETPSNRASALEAAKAVGHFDALGYTHGDAKIKNVGQDQDGRIGMIDYETTTKIDPTNPAEVAQASHIDFGSFVDSLAGRGYLSHDGERIVTELADAYLSAWEGRGAAVETAALEGVTGAMINFTDN